VCNHISTGVYHGLSRLVATLKSSNGDVFPVRGNIEITRFSSFFMLDHVFPGRELELVQRSVSDPPSSKLSVVTAVVAMPSNAT
jgi:hypothetical protein